MPLRFEKVDFEYSPGTPFAFQALKNIDLELAEGKMTAIIGATGSGKTTMVQHLNALLLPSKGTVNVLDFQITAGKKFTEVKKLRHQVGLVFQFAEYQLFEETILKDVCFGPLNFGVAEKDAETIARRCLKTVGIDPADYDKSPLELSGGQKRRVAIAGILAMRPKVLVLDEPTAGLDPQGAQTMMELFRKINKEEGITVLVVTHNMEHVLEFCDEVVVLEKGELLMQTDIRTFFENYEYMEKANINPPAIIRFKELLRKNGMEISSDVLDIEALASAIAGRRVR
ncbi:MAG: energy-coupling factor transporter ATPase [Erysipelotrichaceae bacterium]|nr:energy-coupling factor transporter ATPase [Erysipelotrichaceae bacterium]